MRLATTDRATHQAQICMQGPGSENALTQVIVRNLDEHVVSSWKLKAELHGRSLEQELREILTRAAGLTPPEKLALVDRIAAKQKKPLADNSADLVREDRDSR